MDPNDPTNSSSPPATGAAADAGDSSQVTLDALYGPSTPAAGSSGASPADAAPPSSDFASPSADVAAVGTEPPAPVPAPQDQQTFGMATPQDQLPPMEPDVGQPPSPNETAGLGGPMDAGTGVPADQSATEPQTFGATSSPADYQTPQPGTQDQQFYNDVAPENPDPNGANAELGVPEPPPSDYGAGSYDPNQPQEQLQPETDDGGLPPDQSSPAGETGAPGGLPPIPSRSKMPFIILGGVVVFMLLLLLVLFAVTRGKTANRPAASVQPSATEMPVTCAEDPQNPDCVQSASGSASGSGTQASGSGTLPAMSPQECELLYGGPCPQQ